MKTASKLLRKLAVVIANQKAYRLFALGERPRDLSGLLRHPLADGMRRAAGEVHAAAPDFDEEEVRTTVGAKRYRR